MLTIFLSLVDFPQTFLLSFLHSHHVSTQEISAESGRRSVRSPSLWANFIIIAKPGEFWEKENGRRIEDRKSNANTAAGVSEIPKEKGQQQT